MQFKIPRWWHQTLCGLLKFGLDFLTPSLFQNLCSSQTETDVDRHVCVVAKCAQWEESGVGKQTHSTMWSLSARCEVDLYISSSYKSTTLLSLNSHCVLWLRSAGHLVHATLLYHCHALGHSVTHVKSVQTRASVCAIHEEKCAHASDPISASLGLCLPIRVGDGANFPQVNRSVRANTQKPAWSDVPKCESAVGVCKYNFSSHMDRDCFFVVVVFVFFPWWLGQEAPAWFTGFYFKTEKKKKKRKSTQKMSRNGAS